MKFCFISPGYGSLKIISGQASELGGAEAQVAYLAAGFASIGHRVDLIYGNGDRKPESNTIAGVSCINAFPCWKYTSSLRRFWNTLETSAADIFYARLPNDFLGIVGMFAKLHARSKFVYALANDAHCNPWHVYAYNKLFHNTMYALGLRTADIVAVQHERQKLLVRPFTRADLLMVPNLVHCSGDEIRMFEVADIDAIWVAQIRPAKQLSVFLQIVESMPNIKFAVVGKFDAMHSEREQKVLQNRMQSLKNLHYFGLQHPKNVRALLARSKVLVNTSTHEGFPNTMLEAWSIGVPVISLTVDPSAVIQREGLGRVSGDLTKIRQDIGELVQAQPLNYKIGLRGMQYVRKQHSFQSVCNAFEQIVPGITLKPSASGLEMA